MRPPSHPDHASITLATALHALSDPVRLGMVARPAATDELTSGAAAPPEASVPKSTTSHHLSVLRMAGLVRTTVSGRERFNSLRRDEFDGRFPGLLDAVLANR